MRFLKRFMDTLIYGNFLIAIAATSVTVATYLILKVEINYFILGIVFLSTLFTYTFDRLMILNKIGQHQSERHAWILRNAKFLLSLAVISVLALIPLIFFLNIWSILFLAHIGLLSVAYSFPFIKGKEAAVPLRSISMLKIFMIVYVWATATVLLPAIEAKISLFSVDVDFLTAERALFIFGITLPFDIRDFESDKKAGVRTIPAITGIRTAKILAAATILIFTLICCWHYQNNRSVFLAMIFSGLSTFIMVSMSREDYHEYFYTGLLDATLVIQTALVVIAQQIF